MSTTPYSLTGNVKSSGIVDGVNRMIAQSNLTAIKIGVIEDVLTIDNPSALPTAAYTMYNVRVSPQGQLIRNVPSVSHGGHFNTTVLLDPTRAPNYQQATAFQAPPDSVQNIDETPYVIGQPVILCFVNGSNLNAIILGALPCIFGGVGQNTADYPKKYGSFQGTQWSIDKNGNPSLNIVTDGILNVQVNGVDFLQVNGSTNTVNLGTGTSGTVNIGEGSVQPTVLGTTLDSYLSGALSTWLNTHTHVSASPGVDTGPASASLTGPAPTVPTITSSQVNVGA
jgi:hypothetical protein